MGAGKREHICRLKNIQEKDGWPDDSFSIGSVGDMACTSAIPRGFRRHRTCSETRCTFVTSLPHALQTVFHLQRFSGRIPWSAALRAKALTAHCPHPPGISDVPAISLEKWRNRHLVISLAPGHFSAYGHALCCLLLCKFFIAFTIKMFSSLHLEGPLALFFFCQYHLFTLTLSACALFV